MSDFVLTHSYHGSLQKMHKTGLMLLCFSEPCGLPLFHFSNGLEVLFCPYVDLGTRLQTVIRCIVECAFCSNRRQRFRGNMDPLLLDKTSVIGRVDPSFVRHVVRIIMNKYG